MRTYKIWYMTPAWFSTGIFGGTDPAHDLSSHIYLRDVVVTLADAGLENGMPWHDLEYIFKHQQAEARSLIIEKGLAHTSMSVGDMAEGPDGAFYMVSAFGFTKFVRDGEALRRA